MTASRRIARRFIATDGVRSPGDPTWILEIISII